ncbi:MAG: choice-of-anchor tandem repeat GloVer-containing protein [Terriglobales bacterium]
MTSLTLPRSLCIASALILFVVSPLLHAQVYTELYNFDCVVNGCNPNEPDLFAQGQDGNLYGTMPTQIFGNGTVVAYSLDGTFSTLFNFGPTDYSPQSGLSLGFDGNLYGTAETGGPARNGTVFMVGGGGLTTLYTFTNGADGAFPWAPPIQAPDGNIYGVTFNGATPGTAYKITPSGVFSVIANLPSKTVAPLILGTDGNLYGTTQYGGAFNRGTFFQLTTKGKLKIVYSFDADTHGGIPIAPVMQGADGKFYGTNSGGGAFGQGVVFSVTSGGTLKVLHNFQSATEGYNSTAGLVQGSNQFLYGVLSSGGVNNLGSLYKINTSGKTFSILHSFDKISGGAPYATPTLHTNGKIYGVTQTGGPQNSTYGVLYSFDDGLKPFASLVVIWSGKVGTSVGILGQGFSTATGVKFGSGAGTFTVVNDTYMVATAAAGATTGNVTVLEPGGNLVTPQVFKVIPSITGFSPPHGPVGTSVVISGMSLTQTTSVTFGGVAANTFTVNSDTQVTATVPTGAKTGKIGIKTKGGSATSAAKFTVD